MTPFEYIFIALAAAAVVVFFVALAYGAYVALLSPATRIDSLDVSATHVCTVSACQQYVRYSILDGKDGTEIILRAFKDDVELSLAPVFERTGSPFEEEISFDGVEPKLFDGPGNYKLQLNLSGNLGGALARRRGANPTEVTTTYTGLAKGENEIHYKFSADIRFRPEAERSEVVATENILAGRGADSTLYVRLDPPEANLVRINCKYTLLKAFVLRAISDVVNLNQADLDMVREAGILGPNDNQNFDHPIDVSLSLLLGDGTTVDLGPLSAIGQVFTLPSPVELSQDVQIRIIRRSGSVPFFPTRAIITEVDALVECVEP